MKFEDKLSQLEQCAAKMESGALSLDEMIAAFENGRKLVGECRGELASILQKIEKVTKDGVVDMPFDTQS